MVNHACNLSQRIGAFLCRRKIAALEHDLAVTGARLAEVQREAEELKRERVEHLEELAALRFELDRRVAYRHVLVDGVHGAFALRRGFGETPRLVCPVCFERGAISDLCVTARTIDRYTELAHQIAHVRCGKAGSDFWFNCKPQTYRDALKLAD